jgi:hypothetical protein
MTRFEKSKIKARRKIERIRAHMESSTEGRGSVDEENN